MTIATSFIQSFHCLGNSLLFFRKHLGVILGLGLVAAFGRVIQLGVFGEINSTTHVLLEISIEASRILLFLFVLGLASIKEGLLRIKRFFTQKQNRREGWKNAVQNMKKHWLVIAVNFIGFAAIAWSLNYLIDALAYQTCFFLKLKQDSILTATSSEWTILLFFKNLSVIPFTLVFEVLFILWLTNVLQHSSRLKYSKPGF